MGTPSAFAIGAALLLAVPAAGLAADLEQTPAFVSGRDGYHTYRIPSLIVTKKGTLLAFCEVRKKSASDTGDIDVLLKRSLDGGRPGGSRRSCGTTVRIREATPVPWSTPGRVRSGCS
jgi:sialidase-1